MARIQDLDNDDLLILAARGNRDAQSLLADRALEATFSGRIPYVYGVFVSEILSWLAAAHGQRADKIRLARSVAHSGTLYSHAGMEGCAIEQHAQCLRIFALLADEGEEEFATALNTASELLDLSVIQKARQMEKEGPPAGWRTVPDLVGETGESNDLRSEKDSLHDGA